MSAIEVSEMGLIVDHAGRVTPGGLSGKYYHFRGMSVHQLVLNAFNPGGYHAVWMDRVDHVNRVTTDNRFANLRWSNPVLNGLNSCKAGQYITRAKCFLVQIRVMSTRHSSSVHTVQDAIYLIHHCNRETFRNLECLYKFLARHDVPGHPEPHAWLARQFPDAFLRRLSGLPAKVRSGRRRKIP